MPEYPDITVYVERLRARVLGHAMTGLRVISPSLVRTFAPSYRECVGREIVSIHNIGKRIVFGFSGELFLVLHLMIAGRLRWKKPGFKPPRKRGLAAFYFEHGTLLLTEASPKKRASLHCVQGAAGLVEHDRGGVDVFAAGRDGFQTALARENRTLKRAMTDPRILSGIGNAYSDEILHRAQLSPLKRTRQLDAGELERLYDSTLTVLTEWTDRLRKQVGEGFPDKVTAFHEKMAVHGKYNEPCPACEKPVQRIRYADKAFECNYCPTCQTGGRLLSDRSLARLLKEDWPKTVEELEEMTASRREPTP